MKSVYLVAGARPNFMKIAPIVRAMQAHGVPATSPPATPTRAKPPN
jgi:UDP-N-acetylglucosamine 2-epimerase